MYVISNTDHGKSLAFRSILFDKYETSTDVDGQEAPECFTDLNLDQIVASITAGRNEYNLKPFFYKPLSHVETVHYRHEILRDLENQTLFGHIRSFAKEMRTMRGHLAQADERDLNWAPLGACPRNKDLS
jgi:DNA mismatch repair protein MutS